MSFPNLPRRAAYLTINNVKSRNALSLAVLRDLRDQLHSYNRGPSGELTVLPPYRPDLLEELESCARKNTPSQYSWLVNSNEWKRKRDGLPTVIVLRSHGPVFSSGHHLRELQQLPYDEVKETFALCAEVMSLIHRSPSPVVGVIQGLATAAGAQLALSVDYPIALDDTEFQLPGQSLGLPCTSPSTAVGRRLGIPFTYRMLALAEPVKARDLPGGAVETASTEATLEQRVTHVVDRIANKTAPQAQAIGKWAYWTQMSINGSGESGGDGYIDAAKFAGRVMTLHAHSDDAKEGMRSFAEKRKPAWLTEV